MKELESTRAMGPEPGGLARFTLQEKKRRSINWYRTPIDRDALKALHKRSDLQGFLQAGGYSAIFVGTAGLAVYASRHWPWIAIIGLVFVHGMVAAFLINGVHELGHGTVFRTKALNRFFVHVLAFFGWINHEKFEASHARHHRYTLHAPDDLEVVLPIRLMIRHFFKAGFIQPMGPWHALKETWRIARGRFDGEWELTLYPENEPELRWPAIRWARVILAGHAAILLVSLWLGWWMVPLVFTFSQFYGGWLFFLCNNTQHIGLEDDVPDFRLSCRTFTLNPCIRFLYWQMNYHTEHHMYAAVPCYRLKKLHELIRHDLPPCPHGLLAVWREIASIQLQQEQDPAYQPRILLPPTAAPARR